MSSPKAKNKFKEPALVVYREDAVNHKLRDALFQLGFSTVRGFYKHSEALKYIQNNQIEHVFFDAIDTDLPSVQFLESVLSLRQETELIAVADEIRLDELFAMLRAGARSFLIVPFTAYTVEQSIRYADRERTINEEALDDEKRDAVLTEIVLNNLNSLCHLLSLRHTISASSEMRNELLERLQEFRNSAELARSSVAGGEESFRNIVIDTCIEQATDKNTRLGVLRRRLKRQRSASDQEEIDQSKAAIRTPTE